LFYEYIANILYALLFEKKKNQNGPSILFLAGCALVHLATSPNGDIIEVGR
jgi:hypothetical protein